MANENSSIIRAEENGIEYFTVVATGESGLSGSGMARSLGVSDSSISRLEKRILNAVLREDLPDSLKPLWGKELRFCAGDKGNRKIYTSDAWACFTEYYAFDAQNTTKEARTVYRSFSRIGAASFIQSKTKWQPGEYKASHEAHQAIDRILNTPEPWERMYSKAMCARAFGWFGGNFYHAFCYQWMTIEEKCKQDSLNPIVNGTRKYKIHQFIEPETKEKLYPYVAELCTLIMAASSKQMFITLYQNRFGAGWQQEIFV